MSCLYENDDTNVNPQQVMQRQMYNIYAKSVENVYDLITDSFHWETCDLNSKQGLRRLNSLIKQRRKNK